MDWYWSVLTAILKLGLAFGPNVIRPGDMNFITDADKAEARDFAAIVACRTMLITTPVILALSTFGKADKLCSHAVYVIPIIVTLLLLLLAGIAAVKIDARHFRGTTAPLVVAVVLAVLETGYSLTLSETVATQMCVNQPAASPGTPTPGAAGSAASAR